MASGIDGADRLKAWFERMTKAARKAAEEKVEQEAERIAARMRSVVPDVTGDLKASITVTRGGGRTPSYSHPGGSHTVPNGAAEVTAGNRSVRYAHLVEYGTRRSRSEPFFWPVVRAERRRVRARINKAIRDALKATA